MAKVVYERMSGGQWVAALQKDPTLADKCVWTKLDGESWVSLLKDRPQFSDKCDWRKLDGYNWMDLLADLPEFADKCDWRKLQHVPVGFWHNFLNSQPQFASKCDASKVAVWKRPELFVRFPEIALSRSCDWSRMDGATIAALLKAHPECANRVEDYFLIDRADWDRLIANQPQLASQLRPVIREPQYVDASDKYASYAGWEWVLLLRDNPEMADQCSWDKLTGEDWNCLFRDAPELAEKYWNDHADLTKYSGRDWVVFLKSGYGDLFDCDWWKLSGADIVELLEDCPGYADWCDFSVLDGRDWTNLILLDVEYATRCKDWYLLDGDCWARLLAAFPDRGLERNCDWFKFDGLNWASLLSERPEFADRCKEFAEGCDWSSLEEGDWKVLLAKCPQFADRCEEMGFNAKELIETASTESTVNSRN